MSHTAPIRGSYKEVDAMGLFWSVERRRDRAPQSVDDGEDDEDEAGTPESWTLTAEVAGQAIARTTVRRRRVAEGVRVMPLRSGGVVGTFYEPPGTGPHPPMIVLGGSEGGIPGPAGHAGGLASRSYAVLALGYFRAEGLPQLLENIPLEYFGTALAWLAAQPSVDPDRIGVIGASRGAELALLLGTLYPRVHVVVAYMPSNVVVRGCCDPRTWSTPGRPAADRLRRCRRPGAALPYVRL